MIEMLLALLGGLWSDLNMEIRTRFEYFWGGFLYVIFLSCCELK